MYQKSQNRTITIIRKKKGNQERDIDQMMQGKGNVPC